MDIHHFGSCKGDFRQHKKYQLFEGRGGGLNSNMRVPITRPKLGKLQSQSKSAQKDRLKKSTTLETLTLLSIFNPCLTIINLTKT